MKRILYKKIIFGVVGMLLGISGTFTIKASEIITPIVQVSNLKYSYDQMQQDLAALQERYPGQMVVDSYLVKIS